MKASKTSRFAKSIIAIAIGASGIGTSGATGFTPNQLGTPDDGMVCRTGYTGALTGAAFKCSKASTISVVLECVNAPFTTYVTRVKNGLASTGEDLCVKSGVVITSNGSLNGLTLGQDYVLATVNLAANRIANMDQAEATALGLAAGEVDTVAGQPTVNVDGGNGGKDNATLPVTFFTFAIKTGPGPFVPRSLP
jgi:hypothetical protein